MSRLSTPVSPAQYPNHQCCCFRGLPLSWPLDNGAPEARSPRIRERRWLGEAARVQDSSQHLTDQQVQSLTLSSEADVIDL
ncbi:unnamed protein product [Boreogadus saida]